MEENEAELASSNMVKDMSSGLPQSARDTVPSVGDDDVITTRS